MSTLVTFCLSPHFSIFPVFNPSTTPVSAAPPLAPLSTFCYNFSTMFQTSSHSSSRLSLRWDALIPLLAFVLYCATLHVGPAGRIAPGDAAKFQYIGLILGVPHAPGFPLYVLSTWLWSRLDLMLAPATMINLLSAFFISLALFSFHRALRAAGISLAVSLLATLALLVSPRVWLAATQAGPLALSILLTCLIFYSSVALAHSSSPTYYAVTLALTLVAAGHDTLLLWWSPLVILIITSWAPHAWRYRTSWLALVLGLLLGFGIHAYTYVRSWQLAPVLEFIGPRTSLTRLAAFILGAQFWPNYWHLPLHAMLTQRLPLLTRDIATQLHLSLAALAFPGFLAAALRARRLAVFLAGAILINLAFTIHQFAPDPAASFWLATLAAAFFAALGLDVIAAFSQRLRPLLLMLAAACLASHTFFSARDVLSIPHDFRIRDLLLALPSHAVLLTKDTYATSQLLAYYHWTDRFVRQRHIAVRDTLDPSVTNPVFFFEHPVLAEVQAAGLNASLVASNAHGVMFMLSGAPQ